MKKISKIVIGIFICSIFCSIFTSLIQFSLSNSDFSQNLEYESYTPEIDIDSGWYDGVETFWYDEVLSTPIEWITYAYYGFVRIEGSKTGHTNVLHLETTSSVSTFAKYWFPLEQLDLADLKKFGYSFANNRIEIEFWLLDNYVTKNGYVDTYFQDGNYIRFNFLSNGHIYLYDSITTSNTDLGTFSANYWYNIRYEVVIMSNEDIKLNLYLNTILKSSRILGTYSTLYDKYFDYIHVFTVTTDGYLYFDSLSYFTHYIYVGYSNFYPNSQIQNIPIYESNQFYTPLDNSKVFSLYDSIISEKANSDNNYRNYFITDNLINTDLLNISRILRLRGSNSVDKKYKVIQFFFDNLDNPNSFSNDLNQSIRIRIDTFDNSDNLINKFFVYLDFNNSDGYLYWDWFYRESLSIPKWNRDYSNPIFDFSDYLSGQNLTCLEITLNMFLSYNESNILYYIRTNIAFNRNYSLVFSYDKIIDGGLRSEFYGNQDSLVVKYIDYFNENNGSDYLGNDWYKYNNLAGIRTLQVNDTNWYFNFLDVSYFTSTLYYYEPPEPPEPAPQETPEKPAGFDGYWLYTSYELTTESVLTTVGNGNLSYSYNFTLFHTSAISTKFWYNIDTIEYLTLESVRRSMGDWGLNNWLRDALAVLAMVLLNPIIFVTNMVLLAGQFILYGGFVVLNFLVMYLLLGVIGCEVFWNIGVYWIVVGLVSLLWLIIYSLQWLFYEGLAGFISFLATIFSWIMAYIIWGLLTLTTGNLNDIFTIINTSVQEIASFSVELFQEIGSNMITFLLFIGVYTELTFFILYKHYISKAKGNTDRALALQQAYEFFLKPLRAMWNLLIKIKNLIIWW